MICICIESRIATDAVIHGAIQNQNPPIIIYGHDHEYRPKRMSHKYGSSSPIEFQINKLTFVRSCPNVIYITDRFSLGLPPHDRSIELVSD